MKDPGVSRFTSQKLPMLDLNEATPALPGSTVVGHVHALLKCCIQQYFAWVGAECGRVGGDGDFSNHPGFLFLIRMPRAPERRDEIAKRLSPPKDLWSIG
jgi:hypothetical protein